MSAKKYRNEIEQMMFVSGEISAPLSETTELVEDIVRGQVVEMMTQAAHQAQATTAGSKRSTRAITVDDLMFLIRHDKPKVNRLKTYLSWKDVRKNAKDQDGGAPGEAGDALEDAAAGDLRSKTRKNRVRLPWDVTNMFTEQVPEDDDDDEEDMEANYAVLQRLKAADERTRAMTRDEYVHWSECRQASFTYRKSKRFREWSGVSQLTSTNLNDDIIDILGFLTFEMVSTLTEEALKVKSDFDGVESKLGGAISKKHPLHDDMYLFEGPQEERTPIRAYHMLEAFRRLQRSQTRRTVLRNFSGGLVKKRMFLI